MLNEDVEDLYSRVQVGTRVVVLPGKAPETVAADRQRAAEPANPMAPPGWAGQCAFLGAAVSVPRCRRSLARAVAPAAAALTSLAKPLAGFRPDRSGNGKRER